MAAHPMTVTKVSKSPKLIGTWPSGSRGAARATSSAISSYGNSRVNSPVIPVRNHKRALVGVEWPTMAATVRSGSGQGRSVLNTNESAVRVGSAIWNCRTYRP